MSCICHPTLVGVAEAWMGLDSRQSDGGNWKHRGWKVIIFITTARLEFILFTAIFLAVCNTSRQI